MPWQPDGSEGEFYFRNKYTGEKTKLLRDVISEKLQDEGKNVSIGACVYYQDCALRVDNVKQGVVTRVEVIKNL